MRFELIWLMLAVPVRAEGEKADIMGTSGLAWYQWKNKGSARA